ncbi:hypothetical protein [Stutzerimonas stutzeri]|jgi:hypothetical protein|uniref:Uncharacterized protein n=1 Tax=Stutzerimonas stutzeri TaxID=316 RepID=A0A5S5BFH1_STUST|nr:hypothetical protein [Stutzerimonas stutzeri]TYP64433.1 hypothetical protein A9A72_1231220 [Stutzerimonas stutzeri]
MSFSHIALALALAFSSILEANPIEELKPFFSCTIKPNKYLKINKQENTIIYAFGRHKHPPELELKKTLDEVVISTGNVSGSELTNSISFANGDYTYTVISSVNRVADIQEPKHGILVQKNSDYLTYLPCISTSVDGSLLDLE